MGTTKITVRSQGEMEESGKVNWRGDQVSAPSAQGIYQASQVQLDQLGARRVVGDRVFRYAKAGGAVTVGELQRSSLTPDGENNVTQTTAGHHNIGQKTLNLYSSGSVGANAYAEGYVCVVNGTTPGPMYRIKSHADIAATATGTLTLYDPLVTTHTAADEVSVLRNMYLGVSQCLSTGAGPAGVAPVSATTNDYFWLQTWGPCSVLGSTGTGVVVEGGIVRAGATGSVQGVIAEAATGAWPSLGWGMYLGTESQQQTVYLTIAP